MSPTTQAILRSWSIDPRVLLGLIIASILYSRGWRILHRARPNRFPAWRLLAFLGGLAVLGFAIASPLDAFSGLLLSAHMVQHLLLMSVAPPLILLSSPLLPLLRGLPRTFLRDGLGPFLAWPPLRRFFHGLTHPVVCWLAMAVSLCAWHVPAGFELALRWPAWHKLEHACFFGTSLLFWWPVIRPFPHRPHWPLWSVPIYLLAADVLNTLLCAVLAFSDRVIYPSYAMVPRLFGTTALSDQVAAGVIMWVPGSLVFLIPAAVLVIQLLSPTKSLARPGRNVRGLRPATCGEWAPAYAIRNPQSASRTSFDLLAVPGLGRFLRAQWGRRLLQTVLLVIAIAVIVDGVSGPQVSSTNLAGVLPWTYGRAVIVVALLAAGNFFCMACPFMLVRELGRRLGLPQRAWPRALRSKWLAVALLILFFWANEAFSLWDKPAWTAWIVLNYFFAAFVLDAFFRGASFCKYVCPIGQFHFVNSLISPLEVKVREPHVCTSCRTHDCLRGNEQRRGCELNLYLPRKAGNLDCTLCLDCVRACPHDNIGLQVVAPGADILHDPRRSSLGRLSRRTDVAALALVLVFAAFASAAAMAGPVMQWRDRLLSQMGMTSPLTLTTLLFVAALVLAPAIAMGGAIMVGRWVLRIENLELRIGERAGGPAPPSAIRNSPFEIKERFCRLSLALVPLGAAMWAAHFLFHLLAGYGTVWPVLQRSATELGFHLLGRPDWSMSGKRLTADSLLVLQLLLLDAGLLLTLYIGWRITRDGMPRSRAALGLLAPWACVAIALYCCGIWIFLQPMQMRGLP